MKLSKITALLLSALLMLTVTSVWPAISFALSVDDVFFEEDFDDYAVDTYTNEELAAKNTNAFIHENWTGGYEVKQTQSGKKYLSIYEPTTQYTTNAYRHVFENTFTCGTLVIEMKVLPEAFNTASYGYNYIKMMGTPTGSTTKTRYETLKSNLGNNLIIPGDVLSSYDTWPSNNPTPDSDGFWNLRVVYSRETTNDNWTLAIYDASNGKVVASEVVIPEERALNLTQIDFVDMYAMSASTNTRHINITDLKVYLPRDVVVTQSADYDADAKKVVFSASEKLLLRTVNEETVKVLAPSGADVSGAVSLENDGCDIVVTFPYGLPENGSYQLIADGVQTERNVYVSFAKNFDGTKTVIPFAVAEVSPSEGVISSQQKTVTISFTTESDDSLLEKITFKKADGTDVNGLYETAVVGKNVIVSFGKLNAGNYVLTVDAEFADKADGMQLGTPFVVNYTVEEDKPEGENYHGDDFVVGTEYTADELKALSENISYGSSGKYIIEEVSGDKVITVKTHAAHTGGTVTLALPNAVTDGVFETNVKLKASGDTLARNLMQLSGSSGKVYLLSMNNGSDITISTNTNNAGGAFCDDAPQADENGFFSLKLCMTAGNSEEDWVLEMFDTSESERLFYTVTVPREKLSDIANILVAEIWPVSETETDRSVSISEIWFSHLEFASVSEAPETILPTDETLVFKVDDDIEADGVSVKLISDDNTEINCKCTYSEVERKLYVTPSSFLMWGKTYTLKTTGADLKPYTFAVSPAPCEVGQKTVTPIPEAGTFNASAYVSVNAPEGREVMFVLVGYDENGYPIKLSEKNVVSVGGTATDTVTIENLTAEKCKTVQCFVWEKTEFGYRVIK